MVLLIIGIVYGVIGFCLLNFPPKKINLLYGWRTPSATRSIETWNYANNLGGKLFLLAAAVMIVLYGIEFILDYSKILSFGSIKGLETVIALASIILIFIIGEIKIRQLKV